MIQTNLAISLVTYDNRIEDLERLLQSFSDTEVQFNFYVWDNSATDNLRTLFDGYSFVNYHFDGQNVGFGKGHNNNLNRLISDEEFLIIVNPDIYFERGTISKMLDYISKNENVSQLMPLVKYPNGEIQRLCKQLPRPSDLFIRRFLPKNLFAKRRDFYEMIDFSYNEIREIPFLSGCFSLVRTKAMKRIGGYDERFFMYMEDLDLCRRLKTEGQTIFYPDATVIHSFEKGSYRSLNLLKIHTISAIKYFNKYGWMS